MKQEEKNQILEKFIPLFRESGLKNKEAAERLGILLCYINSMGNEKSRKNIGPKALNAMKDFLDSGEKLSDYQCAQKQLPATDADDFKKDFPKLPEERFRPDPSSNEIIRERLEGEFIKAIDKSGMTNNDAGRHLGISPDEIRYIRDGRMRDLIKSKTWEAVKRFINSGKALTEYNYLTPIVEVKAQTKAIPPTEGHKFILDIEINLSINGRRIMI